MNRELLLLVDALAHEKNVEQSIVFSALESALAVAAKKRFEEDADVRVVIDQETGDFKAFRRWEVVLDDDHEEPARQLAITDAPLKEVNLQVGDFYEEALEDVSFGRISAQTAKQVVIQKIRDAEKEQIVLDHMNRGDKLFTGQVKRVERQQLILESGKVEAILPKDALIPREHFRLGDRVRAYLVGSERTPRGLQIVLSRTCNEFLIHLMTLEVPEIESGSVEIMGAARDPGIRAKMAVRTLDKRIDPIGTCIGVRGTRIQSVVKELGGERIDVVLWDEDPAQFVINALSPAEIASIVIDENQQSIDVVVDEEQSLHKIQYRLCTDCMTI